MCFGLNIAEVVVAQCCLMTYLDNFGQTIFLRNAGSLSENIAQSFDVCHGIKTTLNIKFFLMQCCLEPQEQHYGCSCAILSQEILLGQYCTDKYSQYRWNNITQIKTLCNVVPEAPDNNPQKKLLFNVALICSGQHCTDQNTIQCCPKGSRQHCTRKILRNVVLIFLGQHCTEKDLRIFFWEARNKNAS